MTDINKQRPSFPVTVDETPSKRRAVFSKNVTGLGSWHVEDYGRAMPRRPVRKVYDDSLHLIDDLTNRPLDPLFSDALLTQSKSLSTFSVWFTRVIVFIICVAVGCAGCVFVRQLSTDPRKQVRASLATELQQQNAGLNKITGEVTNLHTEVLKKADSMPQNSDDSLLRNDEMANGSLKVQGQGIVITLADPISSVDNNDGVSPREGTGNHIRVVTDADLQDMVRSLFKAGAEAISINGYRIGVSTSVRTAGQTILIGVNQVTSPYKIESIGNPTDLEQQMSSKSIPGLYERLNTAGINPHITKSLSLKLDAAETVNITDAKRSK
ncbi:uncharacterized protein YlxW (UPF0749 family) [Bifidobacterium commune]|uniref:DUF881 domain-containing protein n=1 Tax=Bifidobacterium commune TaxID=1505727 RepID=A0A1C4H217_9BIFI|nr:DUF881 domain-containing protein [Bifidobacterium commune]MBB2954796.1 uncharacterized protein YlxW (UPF0749 family) [Bifidobacterium commune]SCC78802.1 protein of unknown function [Bifidobacterium commune]